MSTRLALCPPATTPTRRWISLSALLCAMLAACSSSDEQDGTETETNTDTMTSGGMGTGGWGEGSGGLGTGGDMGSTGGVIEGTGGAGQQTTCPGDAADAYQGTPATIPGTVEAEDFDEEGYSDATVGNEGNAYRTNVDVDIKAQGGGHVVGWMTAGEWLEYTVNVPAEGDYSITAQTGAVEAGRTLELSQCGTPLATISVPQVSDWGELGTATAGPVHLGAGVQVIRITVGASDFLDLDSISFSADPSGTGGAGGTGGVETGGTGGVETGGTGGVETGGTGGVTGGTGGTVGKFVGNIDTRSSVNPSGLNFATHWDQITPENAGKWGSVQGGGRGTWNWGTLDAISDYADSNGILFKQHTFVWGSQEPGWASSASAEDVRVWIQTFCQRYPNVSMIDVVNEPPNHTTPQVADDLSQEASSNGITGNWNWITQAFLWADEYCPNAILVLNDYNNIEWPNDNQHFIDIVKAIQAQGAPIDAVGAQSHDLDHASVTAQTVESLLNKLHNDTGLPVYITEMDLSYTDDQQQLSKYQQYFPMFYDADFVPGITIWGWIVGATWSQAPNSGLVNGTSSRPAMTWLMNELSRPAP